MSAHSTDHKLSVLRQFSEFRQLVTCYILNVADAELVMGHFFKIQPNPKFLDPTQPNPQKSSPNPTQPIIDTWYGILGYTENFIQQLLHVTDKTFYKPTVNESYYSAAVLINRHDVRNITQSNLHPTQPNSPKKLKKNYDPTQLNPWMDPTHDQL